MVVLESEDSKFYRNIQKETSRSDKEKKITKLSGDDCDTFTNFSEIFAFFALIFFPQFSVLIFRHISSSVVVL